jgi:hypothetical protein
MDNLFKCPKNKGPKDSLLTVLMIPDMVDCLNAFDGHTKYTKSSFFFVKKRLGIKNTAKSKCCGRLGQHL